MTFLRNRPYWWASIGALLTLLSAEAATGATELGILFFVAVLLTLLVAAPLAYISQKAWPRRVAVGAAAVAVAGFLGSLQLAEWQDARTHRQADVIIAALERYRQRQGTYPDSLGQLTPSFLPAALRTGNGFVNPPPFGYRADSTRFYLNFYAGFLVDATYSSDSREWHYDD